MFGMYHLVGLDQPFPASHWKWSGADRDQSPRGRRRLAGALVDSRERRRVDARRNQGASLSHPLDTGGDLNLPTPPSPPSQPEIIPVSAFTPHPRLARVVGVGRAKKAATR